MRIDALVLEKAVKDGLDRIGKPDSPTGVHTEVRMNLGAFDNKWAVFDNAQKQKLIPLIVGAVTLNETLDDLNVTLRADALDYFD